MTNRVGETVTVQCSGAETVSIDNLTPLQGNLKSLPPDAAERMKIELIEDGFSEPITVWHTADGEYYVLNGHQRLRVLKQLRDEGVSIPEELSSHSPVS